MTEEARQAESDILNEPPPANGHRTAAGTEPGGTSQSYCMRNDHQLLSAYVEGDERAFEALVEKYFRMVYTVAARRTGDWHLAEEIVQSVFLILSQKARGFSHGSSVPGWLIR